MKEFQLIDSFFCGLGPRRQDVLLGIGDDCALVQPSVGKSIAISVDTLVEGTHFLPSMPAKDLGYKALAVNLSDLAAMGAEPAWMTLALTLPDADELWLSRFSEGLLEAAEYYNIALVGGDTTRGPKSITITVNGQLPEGKALSRSGAKNGDWIYVTGTLGDSALGLALLQGKLEAEPVHTSFLIERHYRPTPRVFAGQCLRGVASSCIDLSDGLISDIKHILKASGVGAMIQVESLPLSEALSSTVDKTQALSYALAGGEDYELLFTVPESQKGALETSLNQTGVSFAKIGQICTGNQLRLLKHGEPFSPNNLAFEHFK